MVTTRFTGTPVNRVDGRQKITGAAQYAAEIVLGDMTYGYLMSSPVAGGRIRRIDAAQAEHAPGVLLVLTHQNRGHLGKLPNSIFAGGVVGEERAPLADDKILHNGQYVAMIVAERLEQARYAASLLAIEYEESSFAVSLEDGAATSYKPKEMNGEPLTMERGNVEATMAEAEVRLEATYSTPNEHPCALEPHATVASWSDGGLTVYNSTQWVTGDQTVLASAFDLSAEDVRVLCPFTGGMFGSKAATGAHVILTALAAKKLGRPVKTVLSREQVLTDVGHRSETIQKMELAARLDGTITALRHEVTTHTSLNDEFAEPASVSTRMLYAIPNYATTHNLIRLNVMKPAWMRAPGEAPGQFAMESALDELAYELDLDPVELRIRNDAKISPDRNKPFSSKHLVECYRQGAERFGWNKRSMKPRQMRQGRNLLGWGMGTATYPGYLMGAEVKVRLERGASDVTAVVSTAGSDTGTGMYTMLAITAADALGIPLERVRVELGDSQLVRCALAGGSNLTASTAPATNDACIDIRHQLLMLAAETADGFTGAEGRESEFVFNNGRIAHKSTPSQSIGYRDLLTIRGLDAIEAQAGTQPIFGQNDKFAFQSFGAHFVEVSVDERIGKVRVQRIVSVFDCGRIMSAKTARSQFIGGIVFGIGHALLEDLAYDRAHGQPINADLAGYLVPVHADVPEMDISWIDEPDYNFNSMGCRGVGEIGITGVAAAIANAVYHATGVRVRNLPITPDKIFPFV